MSIKPIDLQTNIGQMHEVGRGEHARSGSVVEQQQLLDKEAAQKSVLINNRLEELKKGEKTEVRDSLAGDREKKEKSPARGEEQKKEQGEEKERKRSHDDRMGKIIDVLK